MLPRSLAAAAALFAFAIAGPARAGDVAIVSAATVIRENGCQDPVDRREIMCDDRLSAEFGRDRFNMLTMMGLLSPYLRAV